MEGANLRNKFRINVAWAISEFHPEWLRENIDPLKGHVRGDTLKDYLKRSDAVQPKESIEFLRAQKATIDRKTLLAYSRQDPAAAYQIAKELSTSGNYRHKRLLSALFEDLKETNPDFLAEIEESTTSFKEKKEIRQRRLEETLANDPEAAYEIYRNTPDSLLRATQLVYRDINFVIS